MKLVILIFATFTFCSPCSPKSFSHSKKIFNNSTNNTSTSQYILVSDVNGKIIIINAVTNEIITTYHIPKISENILAVVGKKFYNIDTVNGLILSTAAKNIMTRQNPINWNIAAYFPKEADWIRNSVSVNGSSIYFATKSGIVYLFDAEKETMSTVGKICEYSNYASLVIVDNILYIHKCKFFYSFDGNSIQELATPDVRYDAGLFRFGENVCRVGGNMTDLYPDPVYCFDGKNRTWTVVNHINEARLKPGIVATESGTYIYGGKALYYSGEFPSFWRGTVEVFNYKTKLWNIVSSLFDTPLEYPQAVIFYFLNVKNK